MRLIILAYIAVIIAMLYGWVHNVVLLCHALPHVGGMEILRAIGVIAAPLGVILGYIG